MQLELVLKKTCHRYRFDISEELGACLLLQIQLDGQVLIDLILGLREESFVSDNLKLNF